MNKRYSYTELMETKFHCRFCLKTKGGKSMKKRKIDGKWSVSAVCLHCSRKKIPTEPFKASAFVPIERPDTDPVMNAHRNRILAEKQREIQAVLQAAAEKGLSVNHESHTEKIILLEK